MSSDKKERVIHVDKLVIHAKRVEVIHDQKEDDFPRRDPWGFWGGRPRAIDDQHSDTQEERTESKDEENEHASDVTENDVPRGPRWI
ncbi:hypothetical protein JMM81_21730 [Bacillus sp. V3B]|uniref:hypothetical protein n=1 Tax=Bacillus sp. V3B TaxID=2804915 RepID=UPI002108BED5|nr:hypothetical protein [Bacillus sp. V3B]MCQ6277485.1 hypothetical protein [Bacillus sp. V3B]